MLLLKEEEEAERSVSSSFCVGCGTSWFVSGLCIPCILLKLVLKLTVPITFLPNIANFVGFGKSIETVPCLSSLQDLFYFPWQDKNSSVQAWASFVPSIFFKSVADKIFMAD